MSFDRLDNRSDKDASEIVSAALAGAGDLAYVWDLKADSIAWSGSTAAVFGIASAHKIASSTEFLSRIHPDDLLMRKRAYDAHLEDSVPFDCEYRIRVDGGETVWLHERATVALDASGEPMSIAGILRIVTKRKEKEARLEFRAHYDELTGHLNGARLRESLDQALSYGTRYGIEGAFLVIGLDTLGMIHDAYAGAAADEAILELGQRIERHVRTSDIVGRLSADCFGVILTNCPASNLGAIALKLIGGIQDTPAETGSGPVQLKVSIGASAFPRPGIGAQDIVTQADMARREALAAPALPFVRYQHTEAKKRDSRHQVAVSEQVMKALRSGRLIFAYQPLVSAVERKVLGHECLLRMVEDDGSITVAGQFMPVIERLGLIRDVDRYVLERAVEELTAHDEATFSINASAMTVNDRSWLRLLFALLRNAPDVAERLTVEITETVALQDNEETTDFVAQVRDLGCRVALDDFGAGYTSFRHLKSLAVDSVKIDGAYVRGVSGNVDNQLFVRTLLGLAKGFNLSTVAECVETEEDAQALTIQGVDSLQGYYFGKPAIEPPWSESSTAAQGQYITPTVTPDGAPAEPASKTGS